MFQKFINDCFSKEIPSIPIIMIVWLWVFFKSQFPEILK